MRLTSRSEYALLALLYIARNEGRRVSVSEIAKEQEIPVKFLEQIVLVLRQNGFLSSTKGRGGGFELIVKPENIALADVVRLFDGALAPTKSASRFYYQATPIEREPKLHGLFKQVRDRIAAIMESTKLSDML
jgi:Rrf2 family cysteine metabolism transcriptional repressor